MKLRIPMLGILMCLLMIPRVSRAQEQTQKSGNPISDLRLDIVLTEYNGDKKVSKLPYTVYVTSGPRWGTASNLRMGVKVPVASGNGGGYNYMNVGTDIDCRAMSLDDGSYELSVNVNRSSIYAAPKGDSEDQNIRALPGAPVMRNFDSHFDVSLRDGQTNEGISAADPLSGNVLKISVTVHVLK